MVTTDSDALTMTEWQKLHECRWLVTFGTVYARVGEAISVGVVYRRI